jgi:excisionase family DNA binding protein
VIKYRELGTAEVAALLDVNDSRVRQLVRSGALPATKLGRDWRIREEDVEAYLALPRGKPRRPRKLVRVPENP